MADTLPETNSSPLKMDGWNTTFLLGCPIFRCKLAVSFREGISSTPPKTNMDTVREKMMGLGKGNGPFKNDNFKGTLLIPPVN